MDKRTDIKGINKPHLWIMPVQKDEIFDISVKVLKTEKIHTKLKKNPLLYQKETNSQLL